MSSSSFTGPFEKLYFEDYVVGSVHEFGFITVEEDEIISFGKRYVPMPSRYRREGVRSEIWLFPN